MSDRPISCNLSKVADACRTTPSQIRLILLREELHDEAVDGTGPETVITSSVALRHVIKYYEERDKGLLKDRDGLQWLRAQLPAGEKSQGTDYASRNARRMAVVGIGRDSENAISKSSPSGYAFLKGKDSSEDYHLWIDDLPDTAKRFLEVHEGKADWLPPVMPQLRFTPKKTDKGWRATKLTQVDPRWSRALVRVEVNAKVRVPCVNGESYLWTVDDPEPGYYVAKVWPGIPTDVDHPSQWTDTVIAKLTEPYRWDSDPVDNTDELKADQSIAQKLVQHTAARVIDFIEEQHRTEDFDADVVAQIFEQVGTHGAFLQRKIHQKVVEHFVDSGTALSAEAVRGLLMAGTVQEEHGAALVLRSVESLLDAVEGISVDLETDGHEIWELGLASAPDAVDEYERSTIGQGLERVRSEDPTLWIGHNLQDWDRKALARNDVDIDGERIWDTLRMEALLSPRRASLALDTSHQAGDDAAVAYQLFRTQVARLLIRKHRGAPVNLDVVLAPLGCTSARVESTQALMADAEPYHETIWNTCVTTANDVLAKASLPPVVGEAQGILDQHPRSDAVHVLYPSALQPFIERLVGVQVCEPTETGGAQHVRSPEAVDPETEVEGYMSQLAVLYRHDCAQHGEPPTVGGLSPWAQSHIRDHPEWIGPSDTGESGTPTRHRAVPLGAYDPGEYDPPDHVIVLAPALAEATSHQVVATYEKEELKDFITEQNLWAQFDGAGSYCALADEQADALGLTAPSVNEGRFWLERTPQGQYAIHHYERDALAAIKETVPDACAWTEIGEDETPAPVLCVMPDTSDVKLTADQQRLSPPTRQRARYWTVQALLLREIASGANHGPTVLLTQDADNLEALRAFFRRQGSWRVPEGGTLRRRLELASSVSSGKGLVILPLERWPALLSLKAAKGAQLVVESLPIKKQQAIRRREVSSADFQDLRTEETTDVHSQRQAVYEQEEDSGTQKEEDLLADRPYSLQRGLQLVAPLLASLARAARSLADDGGLWVLDPRVAPIDLSGPLALDAHRVPTYEAEAYESTLEEAERYFASPTRAEDLELPDGWQETLAEVFLPEKENGAPGEFYPDSQEPYLEPIMRRDSDVLVELPTGTGKSVLFQAPALYHGLQHGLLSVVVTPLKALMVDQVRSLHDDGFLSSVEFINGDLPRVEIRDIYRRIASGSVSLVYVAPERFRTRSFVNAVESRMQDDGTLCYFIFDEVHTVSLWGLDFRPDFLRAKDFVNENRRGPEATPFPCVMLSATITEQIYEHLDDIFHDYPPQSA